MAPDSPSPHGRPADPTDIPTLPPANRAIHEAETMPPVPPGDGPLPPCDLPADGVAVPGYEIIRELGRGGMGVVYEARHRKLSRVVALKMILGGGHAGRDDLARFLAEAEAVARLQHPNIVQLYESGQHNGLPYFTLEFVGGGSLADQLKGVPLPPGKAAKLVEQLARGVHYAHTRGIVHRDLKPGNVLLAEDGTPKLTDFGLARRVEVGSGLTATGAVLGTPSYMAPEQAEGKGKEAGPAADTYALGAILYECLTGRPPFRGPTPLETLVQVLGDEPVPPTQLRRAIPRDLETICLKCLQKNPHRRYATAAALADDLGRWLRGEPILARPVAAGERLVKWVRRKPVLAGFWAVVALFLLTLAVGGPLVAVRQAALREEADRRRDEAEAARADAEREALRAATARQAFAMNLAWREWQGGNLGRTAQLLGDADPRLTGWEYDFLNFLCPRKTLFVPFRPPDVMAFSPDGSCLVTVREETEKEANPEDRKRPWQPGDIARWSRVAVWDLAGASPTFTLRIPRAFTGFEYHPFDPTGRRLAIPVTCLDPKTNKSLEHVKIFDVGSGKEVVLCPGATADRYTSLAFSPDGKSLAAGTSRGVRVWNAKTGEVRFERGKVSDNVVTGVCFSPDSRCLASVHGRYVQVWDAATGEEARSFSPAGQDGSLSGVAFAPDGRQLFAVGCFPRVGLILGRYALLWDVGSGEELWRYREKGPALERAVHAGNRLLAVSRGGEAIVWPLDGTKPGQPRLLTGGVRLPHCLALNADGTLLALAPNYTQRRDGRYGALIQFTPLDRLGPAFATAPALRGEVLDVALSPDGRLVAAAARLPRPPRGAPPPVECEFRLWDRRTKAALPAPELGPRVMKVAFSPDGKLLAAASPGVKGQPGRVVIWEAGKDQAAASFPFDGECVAGLVFSPRGKRLAVAVGWQVTVWDVGEGRIVHRFSTGYSVNGIAFHPDGELLAACDNCKNRVGIWSMDRALPRYTLDRPVEHVGFGRDGKHLFVLHFVSDPEGVGSSGSVSTWDWAEGEKVSSVAFKGYGGNLAGAAFAPDGRRFATPAPDGTIRFWDPKTGQEMFTLDGLPAPCTCLAFTPDGRRLACGTEDGSLLIWEAAPRP